MVRPIGRPPNVSVRRNNMHGHIRDDAAVGDAHPPSGGVAGQGRQGELPARSRHAMNHTLLIRSSLLSCLHSVTPLFTLHGHSTATLSTEMTRCGEKHAVHDMRIARRSAPCDMPLDGVLFRRVSVDGPAHPPSSVPQVCPVIQGGFRRPSLQQISPRNTLSDREEEAVVGVGREP
jgi:hypothetical protein